MHFKTTTCIALVVSLMALTQAVPTPQGPDPSPITTAVLPGTGAVPQLQTPERPITTAEPIGGAEVMTTGAADVDENSKWGCGCCGGCGGFGGLGRGWGAATTGSVLGGIGTLGAVKVTLGTDPLGNINRESSLAS